jgi:PAS domain S-box-containing protein
MNNFFNTFPLPTIVVDINLTILNVNESGLLFFDIKLDTICSKKITFIFPQLDVNNLKSKQDFEIIYVNHKGIKHNLTIQFCSFLKEDIYGLFYIKQTSLARISSLYSLKKLNLLTQKLNIFESFLNQIDKGVFIFNNHGQLTYLNENAINLFELKYKNIKKNYCWQLFDFFENELQWNNKKKLIEIKKKIEFTLVKFDTNTQKKSTLLVSITHKLIENKNYYVITYSDITSIEKDKFVISEKENQLNLFHKNIPAAIYEFVISGKESYFNYISNAFQRIFGFQIALNDKKWNSKIKIHPDDFQKFTDTIFGIKENISEFKFIGRFLFDDKIIWFETNASVAHKDNLIIFYGIISNITDRKEIEEEVNNKRKFIDSVLFNLPADVAVFDKNHNYQFINSKGIANDDLRNWMIGKTDFDYCTLKGIDTKLAIDRHVKFNVSKEKRQNVDWIDEIIKDGKKNYIFRRFYPYYDNNEFIYMIGYGVDVTELKLSLIHI